MQEVRTNKTRKSFLIWVTAILGSFAAYRIFKPKPESKKTVMLTEDGRLVEIDSSLLGAGSKKITNPELQAWVKSKPSK